jgi:hypothetical protein
MVVIDLQMMLFIKIYMRNLTTYTVFQNELLLMLKHYTQNIYGGGGEPLLSTGYFFIIGGVGLSP